MLAHGSSPPSMIPWLGPTDRMCQEGRNGAESDRAFITDSPVTEATMAANITTPLLMVQQCLLIGPTIIILLSQRPYFSSLNLV